MYKKLKEICDFIQADDKNSDILDCYQEFEDGELDGNTLIEICQNVLEPAREDYMTDPRRDEYVKHAKWLGLQ